MIEIITTTRLTKHIKEARWKIFKEFLTKQDFENKLEELRKEGDSSGRASILKEIIEMFSSLGIDCEKGQDNAYYENLIRDHSFSLPEDIEEKFIQTLYQNFKSYPTPEVYMNRIVSRLETPSDRESWCHDTLRLKILKQFIKYGNYLSYEKEITDKNGKTKKKKVSLYGGEVFIKSYIQQKLQKPAQNREKVLENLDDGIFSDLDESERKIKQLKTEIKNLNRTLEKNEKQIKKLKSEEKDAVIKKNAGIKADIERLTRELKEEKKKNKQFYGADSKYALLKMADDLANGRFKTGGATKRELYLFAMVFNMTYYCEPLNEADQSDTLLSYESDIEKNLFQDYYTNNLMRFISEAYDKDANTLESDPPGQGINYKNFAEMIYLYFIFQDIDPAEKIKQSAEMIERLKNSPAPVRKRTRTKFFRQLFTETILELSEEEFEQFIAENYDCNVTFRYVDSSGKAKKNNKSVMQVQTEQKTAYHEYEKLMKKLQEECGEAGITLEDCSYGLWFEDIAMKKQNPERFAEKLKNILGKSKNIDQFISLLYSMHRFIGEKSSSGLVKALNIQKPELMTRTSLIIAYYYWYNLHCLAVNDKKETPEEKSFLDVYYDYTSPERPESLNSYLQKAGYQLINDKDIFDITIIFSSYDYIN